MLRKFKKSPERYTLHAAIVLSLLSAVIWTCYKNKRPPDTTAQTEFKTKNFDLSEEYNDMSLIIGENHCLEYKKPPKLTVVHSKIKDPKNKYSSTCTINADIKYPTSQSPEPADWKSLVRGEYSGEYTSQKEHYMRSKKIEIKCDKTDDIELHFVLIPPLGEISDKNRFKIKIHKTPSYDSNNTENASVDLIAKLTSTYNCQDQL